MRDGNASITASITHWLRTPTGYLAVVIVVLGAFFGALAPGFLSIGNGVDLVEGAAVTAIMATGLLVVLVVGGIDISFAATASVAQYLAALAATKLQWPLAALIPFVIAVNLATGALLGGLNALLIDRLRATSIIITISTMSVYFALLMYATSGRSIYGLPGWWSDPVVLLELGGEVRITLPIAVMCAVMAATSLVLNRTALGRQVFALGGNPEAAQRIGIDPLVIQVFAYGYLGLMAGLAGFMQAHRVGEAVPNALVGGELFVLAAAVLGGASLSGGTGSVGGVALGILLLAMLRNGLNLLGVSPYCFQVLLGIVVLASAAMTGMKPGRRAAAVAPA